MVQARSRLIDRLLQLQQLAAAVNKESKAASWDGRCRAGTVSNVGEHRSTEATSAFSRARVLRAHRPS
eukprot:3111417-Prymnesium_polylepis.6